MLTKTFKYFNQLTRQALIDKLDAYVTKAKSLSLEIARVKSKYGLEKIYRFDLGENVDGFSPKVQEYLDCLHQNKKFFEEINEYPDITHRVFREEIAALHNISREQIVISTGLDSILDLISRVFFDFKDTYVVPIPDFFLFENYSERMGAIPLYLPIKERDNFEWTHETLELFRDHIYRFRPKLVWISNPCNPTGKSIPLNLINEIINITYRNNVFIVIDEAYGEYFPDKKNSSVSLIKKFDNLMVLRTFSKAYGLAGIRLGYLMCSSKDVINAMLMHRQYFPAPKLAINLASVALKDQEFVKNTLTNLVKRKEILFSELNTLKTFEYIKSVTNIFMLKNKFLDNIKLKSIFKKYGIFTSLVNISDDNNKYLRITIKDETDNSYFIQVCKVIEKEVIQMINLQDLNFSYS